ncbi:MAG: M28 family peptidase [Flavobacteriaceae bacterium]|nr:M28 family peptidase [Flavobacteriaceae bacterium]
MNKLYFALAALAASAVILSCKPLEKNQKVYADSITQTELKDMLYTYASDTYQGRETGTPGQKKAVEFIKQHYVNLGISSPIAKDDYFQEVPLQIVKAPTVHITINDQVFEYYKDFIAYGNAQSDTINVSEIVYAGYGIIDKNYNDYENLNVKDKVVIVKAGEPKDKNGNNLLSGNQLASKWNNGRAGIATKRDAAKNQGAKAVFFIDDELFNHYAPNFQKRDEDDNHKRLSLVDKDKPMYVFLISEAMGKLLAPSSDSSFMPTTHEANISITYINSTQAMTSENVIAYIPGTEKPEEYIVLSAHLDHIGINDQGEVFNGADDDGSGTVAIIEIAEAFKKAVENGHGPKRSILFLHVTGEEKGLLGSRYYTDIDPIVPLSKTIANLNIDMIGRTDPKHDSNNNRNYLYLIGSDKLSTELHNISEEVNNKYTNIEFDYTYNDDNDPNRFYYRSDHYNFAKNNVPVIFYFNGTHDDYHKISDTPDKIQYDLLEHRTKLIFHTAWELANREKTIAADKASTE